MAAYDTIKKVKLKDPETLGDSAAILYPLTGLNAITAGTKGDAATTYIASAVEVTSNNVTENIYKILPKHLSIINNAGYVDNTYLAFVDNTTGKIIDTYLNFIVPPATAGGQAKISQDYLPSYVDDVVEIPVIEAPDYASPTVYNLMIQEGTDGSVKTYTFYRWNGSEWVLGGGEASKIYIAATASGAGDGSIYRCKTGSTTQAIKISENPYGINQTETNGVWLSLDNTTLSAKARVATNSLPGTVIIDTTPVAPTKNVALAVTEGTVSVDVAVAGATQAGIVFAVGTENDYKARSSAYGDSYVVPTAAWTRELFTSAAQFATLATYQAPGIVQISETGHMTVSSGVVSVHEANASSQGVVYLIDTINEETEGNAGKVVTQAGIVSYVGSALKGYQKDLSEGNGIDISKNDVISVATTGDALGFTLEEELFVSSATGTKMGAVLITGDSSYIAGATTSVDGKPVAVNGKAVKDYIDYRFTNYTPTLTKASLNAPGVVQIRRLADALNTDEVWRVPQAWDVKSALDTLASNVKSNVVHDLLNAGDGIEFTSNTLVMPHTLTVAVKLDGSTTSPLYFTDETKRVAISAAGKTNLGVVQIGNGLEVLTGGTVYVPMVSSVAEFAVDSNSSKAATVTGITAYVSDQLGSKAQTPLVSGVGITIAPETGSALISVNYTGAIIADGNAINVMSATADSAGVVYLISDINSVDEDNTHQALQAYAAKTYIDTSIAKLTSDSNPIYITASTTAVPGSLQILDADYNQRGVVTLATTKALFSDDDYKKAAPTVSAVKGYISDTLTGYQTQLQSGAATKIINGNTVDVLYNTNQMSVNGANQLTINIAGSTTYGVVKIGTGLDITGGSVYLPIVTNSASFDVTAEQSKPPTVGAVSGYVADCLGSTLTNYQSSLSNIAPIQLVGDTISLLYDTDQMYTKAGTSALTINLAGATTYGLVSAITNMDSAVAGSAAQVVQAYAAKAYVDASVQKLTSYSNPIYMIQDPPPDPGEDPAPPSASAGSLQIYDAGDRQRGVVTLAITDTVFNVDTYQGSVPTVSALKAYVAGELEGLVSGSGPIDVTSGTVSLNYDTEKLTTSANGTTVKLSIPTAASNTYGVVKIGTGLDITGGSIYLPIVNDSASFDVAADQSKPPTVGAVVGYIDDQLADYQEAVSAGGGITFYHAVVGSGDDATISGTTIAIDYDTERFKLDPDTSKFTVSSATAAKFGVVKVPESKGLVLSNGSLSAAIAGSTVLGAVKIGSSIDVSPDGTINVQGIVSAAQYVSAVDGTDIDLGGVRVVSNAAIHGIGLSSGNLFLNAATKDYIGGIQLASANTGLGMQADGSRLKVNFDTNVMSLTDNNELTVKYATTANSGAVLILTDKTKMSSAGYASYVPIASTVDSFVSGLVVGARTTLTSSGGGIKITSDANTVTHAINYALQADCTEPLSLVNGQIAIRTASANISGTVGPVGTLGAVYVIGTTVRNTFTNVDYTANTVPTESAVRGAINTAIGALPYITYEEV